MKLKQSTLSVLAALGILSPLFSPTSLVHAEPNSASTPKVVSQKKLNSGIELQWMDLSVRPQDDFYRYVSGKWLDKVEIPSDRSRWGAFEQLRDLSESRSKDLVENLLKKKDVKPGSEEQKIADLYRSFMNQEAINAAGIKPLKPIFSWIDQVDDKAKLPALFARLSRAGVTVPFGAGVAQDARDATRYAVYSSQSGLGLPDRDYYLKLDDAKFDKYRKAYVAHIDQMFSMADLAKGSSQGEEILKLETEIAKIQWDKVENRNPVKTYNKLNLTELQALAPNLHWNDYLAEHGSAGKVDYVIVRQPSYFTNLSGLIEKLSLDQWKNYLRWHVLNAYAPFLSEQFATADFNFNSKTLRDVPEQQARWKRGIGRVEESLGEALGKLYVAKYFPPEHKKRMQELVANLTEAYRQSIVNLTWMGPETRKQALDKLSKFTPKIGYPDKWRDYSDLHIKADDLVGNVMRSREFSQKRNVNKLGKPIDRSEWGMTPQTVNAYYNSRLNEIVFPAAILQPPFFNAKADDAVNYGGIVAVIGHEISHGFDDSGSQSDGDGNLRNWWTSEDSANFKKLTQALIEQYNQYAPIPGYNVNGALTLGENIADNSGLSIAFKAYQLSLKGKPAPVIDNFTGNQRVFLGWSQVWRGKTREAETILRIKTDSHSPAMVRGSAPLRNLDPFYEAFNVKPGDKMYLPPEQRIRIW